MLHFLCLQPKMSFTGYFCIYLSEIYCCNCKLNLLQVFKFDTFIYLKLNLNTLTFPTIPRQLTFPQLSIKLESNDDAVSREPMRSCIYRYHVLQPFSLTNNMTSHMATRLIFVILIITFQFIS